jgi:hypothetical protein
VLAVMEAGNPPQAEWKTAVEELAAGGTKLQIMTYSPDDEWDGPDLPH